MIIPSEILAAIIASFCLNTSHPALCEAKVSACVGAISGTETKTTTLNATDCMRLYKARKL